MLITEDQIDEVILYLSRLSPAMRVVDGMPEAWHDALADQTYVDVVAAARELGRKQTFVGVADIRAVCKRYRGDRLRSAGNIHALVQADRDDPVACLQEFQRLTREIAAGVRDARGQLVEEPKPGLRSIGGQP